MSSDFMAAVTIFSDFRAQEEEICYISTSPTLFAMKCVNLQLTNLYWHIIIT